MPILEEERSRTLESGASRGTPTPSQDAWLRYADSTYLIGARIASGGMGTVHLGLKRGALGFRRLVAIKRLHGHLAHDPDFAARFKDEIRFVSRLNHPNIVQTLDVLSSGDELALVMEFVDGVTLYELLKDAGLAGQKIPVPVAVGIVAQMLHGLHAAHELVDDQGRPLQLVHRDVSPQNVLIARDGLVKVFDFGVAKASSATHITRTGQISGKPPYMAPEQVLGGTVDRRTDVFSAGVVLWEALTGQRLFRPEGGTEELVFKNVLDLRVSPPSEVRPELDPALERIVLRALDRDPSRRFGSARDFALALEEAVSDSSCARIVNSVMAISGHRIRQKPVPLPVDEALPASSPDVSGQPDLASEVTNNAGIRRTEPTDSVATARRVLDVSGSAASEASDSQTSDVQVLPMGELFIPKTRSRKPLAVGVMLGLGAILLWQGVSVIRERESSSKSDSSVEVPARTPDEDAPNVRSRDEIAKPVPAGTERSQLPQNTQYAGTNKPRPGEADAPSSFRAETSATETSATETSATETSATETSATETTDVEDRPPPQRKAGTTSASHGQQRKATAKPTKKPTAEAAAIADTTTESTRLETPASKPSCSPPTYTDAEGIRHFRPECLW